MAEEMTPPKRPKKNEVTVRIDDGLYTAAVTLANSRGVAIGDLISQAVERGLPQLIEEDNSRNWWLINLAKPEMKALLESIPPEKHDEAIAYLKSLKGDE